MQARTFFEKGTSLFLVLRWLHRVYLGGRRDMPCGPTRQMSEDFRKLTEVFRKLSKDLAKLTEVFPNLTERNFEVSEGR